MGVDIHIAVCSADINKKNQIFLEPDFPRQTKWFDNLDESNITNSAYYFFPRTYGIPDNSPESIAKCMKTFGCFGFFYCTVQEYIDWCDTYCPDTYAGWITLFEQWELEHRGIFPVNIAPSKRERINEGFSPNELIFTTVYDPHDPAEHLRDEINSITQISGDDYIVFYFDC